MSKKWTQKDVCSWIATVANNPKVKNMSYLKDGTILCEFMNEIIPGSCKGYKKSGFATEHRENIGKVVKAMKNYGVKNLFDSDDLWSFSKRDKVVKSFIEFNDMLVNDSQYDGPLIKKVQQNSGPTLSLLEAKQQEVAKKNVKFDRVKHNIVKNVDEEKEIYKTYTDET